MEMLLNNFKQKTESYIKFQVNILFLVLMKLSINAIILIHTEHIFNVYRCF